MKGIAAAHGKSDAFFKRHTSAMLAISFVNGAMRQIEQYKTCASRLEDDPLNASMDCLHEVSCLLEDLETIAKYMETAIGEHDDREKWRDLRDHLRHDLREVMFGDEDQRTVSRAKRLRIPNGLMFSISFKEESFTIGSKTVPLVDVTEYLDWAKSKLEDVIQEAQSMGRISSDN